MKLSEFFQESGSKQLSSTRLGFLVWVLGLFCIYAYRTVFVPGCLEPLPQSLDVIGITLILGGLKFGQKFKENGNGKAVEKSPLP